MALSASSSALLRRLLCSSTPASSSVFRATFCSSSGSGPSHTPPPPSSIFGDDTEVVNVPPLTTPKLFISGNNSLPFPPPVLPAQLIVLRSAIIRAAGTWIPLCYADVEITNEPYDHSGLSRLTTDEKLQGVFASFGRLLDAKVVTDKVSGRSKGFGFVRYATIEEAEKARQEMNAKFLDGWVIFVDPAKPRQPKPAPQQDTRSTHAGFTTNKTVGWCG